MLIWIFFIGCYRSTECTYENPAKNIVFLRSHRTGSHTVGNIFYRYGENNNLYFGLPHAPNFQYYWPLRFHHSYVDKKLIQSSPNLLINIARNNIEGIRSFAAKETYNIAVVRHPVPHFQSIYDYIDMSYFMEALSNDTNLFEEFAKDPGEGLKKVVNHTKVFDPMFHLLKNGMFLPV